MLGLFPEGFEERDDGAGIELAMYTDTAGEKRARAVFGDITAVDVLEGWEDRWREFHHGVRVGSLWVGPPWERPPDDAHAVVIEPGRAFGTGAHPTTRLCLDLLAELRRGSLLDVGCGSGVLAVAGARLGFAPVHAVDHDPVAVEATLANAAANGLGDRVTAHLGSLPPEPSGEPYPLVLANLVAAVLIDLAGPLAAHTAPGGTLLASGIIEGRADEVLAVLTSAGFVLDERLDDGEWVSFRLLKWLDVRIVG